MKKVFIILAAWWCVFNAYAQLNTDRILDIGQNALYFQDYVLSIQYFNQVIKIKPYLADPYVYRAIAKIELGDYRGADEDCSKAIDRNPFLTQAYYVRGFARRSLGYFPEAVSDFTKALEFSPNNPTFLMNRIDTREQNKDYKGAMDDLDLYMRLFPGNSNLLYEKGRIQMDMKDTVGATATFDRFVQTDSSSVMSWSARALLRLQMKDINGALSDYDEAIKLGSKYSGDYINRGIINVQKNNFRQALADYDKAIQLDPKAILAYYNRGLLRATLGDNNNALTDLNKVIENDTTNNEAILRRAMLESTLGKYKSSTGDYNTLISRYPYFLPAYLGIADNEQALGHVKNAFRYRMIADKLEKNKDYYKRKEKEKISTENKIAANVPDKLRRGDNGLMDRFLSQDNSVNQDDSDKFSDPIRGAVQDKYAAVVNEKNFVLTYYAKSDEIRRTNLFYPAIEQYNRKNVTDAPLKITNNELPLTAELINVQFDRINQLTSEINSSTQADADLYFKRAIEFSLVQDFSSAIDDLTKVISLNPNYILAYFCRANLRFKLNEYNHTNRKTDLTPSFGIGNDKNTIDISDKQLFINADLIMDDYDNAIRLNPDFSFAYYNKANILCTQKDFKTAIQNYSKAIEIDPDFAEAYFNRGLAYIYIGEDSKGLFDLSKAGELGIYKSYNLIQRFRK